MVTAIFQGTHPDAHCPRCGTEMQIVSVITSHPVIDRILRHVQKTGKDDLWGARAPPAA